MSEREFLRLQYKRLSVLQKTPQDPEAVTAWIDAIGGILREIGETRLQAGVERCLREMQYFPTPRQVREMVPTIVSVETHNGRTCVKCNRVPFGYVWAESPPCSGKYGLRKCDHVVNADSKPEPADPPSPPQKPPTVEPDPNEKKEAA